MNYLETMEYIENTAKFGSNLGLERTEKILEFLGNPHEKIKTIHIAGTNGKGSTTAMVSAVLLEEGYKVGMYTSPYIEEFEERIQVNGHHIPKEQLSKVVTEVSEAVEKVVALGYDHPTEFEIITCAMFLYFYKQEVDFAVVEVGLGGRLDSTNVIRPLVSVITSISLDHMQILGDTLEKISMEKAGIIKNNVPLVLYPQEKEVQVVMEKICEEKKAPLILVPREAVLYKGMERGLQALQINVGEKSYEVLLSLLGKHQQMNCATALCTLEELKKQGISIKTSSIVKALCKVKWIGRLEIMKTEPLVVMDGAHNIDGITRLRESIENCFEYKNLILLIGILADKEVEKMLSVLVPMATRVIAVTPHSERGELAKDLKKAIEKYNINCEAIEEYELAYNTALKYCEKGDLLLLCGSLYMIGDMRKIIKML